jgi:hypothetical protein
LEEEVAMALSPDIDAIVTVVPREEEQLAAPIPWMEAPPRVRRFRRWVLPAAIGLAGLIASGSLGGLFLSTSGQRDNARHHLAATRATLATTQQDLKAAQSEVAARKATSAYVSLYISDSGKVLTDYETIIGCNSFSECRTAAQQELNDLQTFQLHRTAAGVPTALASADGMLTDALSAAIAADQEFITGLDTDNVSKLKDGGHKFDRAMLSIAKAETALAAGLQ